MSKLSSEQSDILFMQTRILRLASKEWKIPVTEVNRIFSENDVPRFIEDCYDMFHCEGDYAVLEDIEKYLAHKGVGVYASVN